MAKHTQGIPEILIKVLSLEIQSGFADNSVLGGVDELIKQIADVNSFLNGKELFPVPSYSFLNRVDREHWIFLVRKFSISNVKSDLKTLLNIRRTTVERLDLLGINNTSQLLSYFPLRHIDYSNVKKIFECKKNDNVTLFGKIIKSTVTRMSNKLRACKVVITDDTGFIEIVWYGQPYLVSKFAKNKWLSVSGKITQYGSSLRMSNPEYELIDLSEEVGDKSSKIIPVYSVKEKIPQQTFRNLMKKCIMRFSDKIDDYIPYYITEELQLMRLSDAITQRHFPTNINLLRKAEKRFFFEMLLFNQLFMLLKRKARELDSTMQMVNIDNLFINDLKEYFDFELTPEQKNSIDEIILDIQRSIPMRRMLQGEVGSGKTIVALICLLAVVRSGYQGAFMVPTEILAEQHFINLKEQFSGVNYLDFSDNTMVIKMPGVMDRRIVVGLLLGNLSQKEKSVMKKLVNRREVDLIIGTHALFQEDFTPKKLGLVVVDEQHRFGVNQRDALVKKSEIPHLLSMSATPIPRSLSLTLYGDLDLSTIRNVPEGREAIQTKWCKAPVDKKEAYQKIKQEILKGRQIFVVCPLIHKSEKLKAFSLEEKINELESGPLSEFKICSLHGEMNMKDKSEVMHRFNNNEFNIMLATPVIEVGVDIPNATVMLIESADRFGLAQLHQLRGRVGRGPEKSFCFLFSDEISEDAALRLNSFEKASDGFSLAEKDLNNRGPGDYVGSRQSGISELPIEIFKDFSKINLVRTYAENILKKDPELKKEEHVALRAELMKRFEFSESGIS